MPALDDFNYNYIADDADLDNRLEQFRVYQGGPPQTEALSTSRDYSSNLSDLGLPNQEPAPAPPTPEPEPEPAPVRVEPLSGEAEVPAPRGGKWLGPAQFGGGGATPTTVVKPADDEAKPEQRAAPRGGRWTGDVQFAKPVETKPADELDYGRVLNWVRDFDRMTGRAWNSAASELISKGGHILSNLGRKVGTVTASETVNKISDGVDDAVDTWKKYVDDQRPYKSLAEARKDGATLPYMVESLATGGAQMYMLIQTAAVTGPLGLIGLMGVSGAVEEARREGSTNASMAAASALSMAETAAALKISVAAGEIQNMAKRVATNVAGQLGLSQASTAAHPAIPLVAGQGYELPTKEEFLESGIVGAGMGLYAPRSPSSRPMLPLDIEMPPRSGATETGETPPARRPPEPIQQGPMPTEQGVLTLPPRVPETSTEAFPRTRLEIDTDPRQGELPGTEMTQPDLPGVRQPPVRLDTRTPEELALRPEPSGRTLESPTSEALPRDDLPGQLEMPGTGPRGVLEEGPASPMRDPAVQAATEAAVNPRGARPSEPPDPRQGEMFPQGQLPLVERPGERPVQLDQRTPEEVAAAQAPPEPTARAREPDLTGQRELELEQPLPFQPDIRTDVRAAEAPRPEPVQGELPLETPTPAPAPEAAAKPATRTQIRQRLAELGATKEEIQASNRSSIAQAREDLAQREGAAKPVEAPVEAPVPAGPQLRRAAPAPEAQAPTPAPAEPAPAPAERRPTIARPRPRRTVEVGGRGEAATAEEQPPLTEKTLSLLRRKEARATGERTSTENLGRTSEMAEEAAGQLREEAEQTLPGSQVAREVPIEEIESAKTMPTREGGLVETRSPTTTDMRLKYTDALHDFLQGTKDIDEALKAVPTQEAGTRGRPRREAGLADYLEKFAIPRAIKNELADQLARKRVTEIIDKHGRGEITTATRDRLIQKHVDQMKVRAEKRGPKQELERENLSQLRQVAEFLRKIAKDEKGSLDLDRLGELWRELRERGGPVIGAPSRRELSQNDLAESRNRTERRVADLETVAAEKLIERINKPASDLGHNDSLQDYMRDVINDPSSRILTPDIHELINHMLRLLPDPIPVGTFEGLGRRYNNARLTASEGKSPGGYMPDLDMVAFSKNFGNRAPAETVAHEAIHAVTSPYLKYLHEKVANSRQPAWETLTPTEYRHYKVIEAIREEASNIAHFEDLNREEFRTVDYAIQGQQRGAGGGPETGQQGHELLSMFLTNPEAGAVMARSQTSPNFRASLRAAGYKGNVSNIWSAFKEWVKDVIGYRKGSVLDRVLDPFTDIMEAGAAHREYLKTGWQKDMQSGIDFAPIAAPRQRRTTGSEGPISLVGERARAQMRPFGEAVRDFLHDDRGSLDLDRIAKVVKGLTPGATLRTMRATLPGMENHMIAQIYKGDLPAAEQISQAQGRRVAATAAYKNEKIQDRNGQLRSRGDLVQEWSDRLLANPRVDELHREASFNRVFVDGPAHDFEARNAHLNEAEMNKARELRGRFDRLRPDEQALLEDVNKHYESQDLRVRDLQFRDLLKKFMPDLPASEVNTLAEHVKSKRNVERLIRDPEGAAQELFGERYQHSPAMVRELAKIQRQGWVEGNYRPLTRPSGEYVVEYGEKGTPSYGVEFYQRSTEAQARRDKLIAEEPGLRVSDVMSRSQRPPGREFVPDQVMTDMVREMKKRGATEEQIATAREALNQAALQRAASSASAASRMKRDYVRGNAKEGSQALWDHFNTTAARIGNLMHGAEEAAAFKAAREQVSQLEKASGTRAPAAEIARSKANLDVLERRFAANDPAVSQADIEHARQVHKLLANPPSSSQIIRAREVMREMEAKYAPTPEAQANSFTGTLPGVFSKANFIWHLARLAHLPIQMTGDAINTQAFLGGTHGMARTAMEIGRATANLAPAAFTNFRTALHAIHGGMKFSDWDMSKVLLERQLGRLPESERGNLRDLYNAALERGMFQTFVRESQVLAKRGAFEFGDPTKGRRRWTNLGTNMMNLFGAGEHATDTMSRWVMLRAGYELARAGGMNPTQAIDSAVWHAGRITPIYGEFNAPRVATERSPLGTGRWSPTLMQFKQYGMHQITTQAAYAREAVGRGPEAAAARKALAMQMALNSLAIGLVPNLFPVPVSMALGAWDMFFGDGEKPHDYDTDLRLAISEAVGEDNEWLATLASRGILGLFNIDANRSLKLTNPTAIPELRSFDGAGVLAWMAQAVTGSSGDTAGQIGEGLHEIFSGNWERGAQLMLPRIGGDQWKAYQMATEGVTNKRGHTIMGPDDVSTSSVVLKALGFNPYETSLGREQRYAMEELQDEVSAMRRRVIDRYVRSDGQDMDGIDRYIDKYGHISPLTSGNLRDAMRDEMRRRNDAEALGMKIPQRARREYLDRSQFR